MSNGTPPARPDDAINTGWLSPQERAPSPPRDEGCKHNGFGDSALLPSKGSPPTPSPPSKSTSPSSLSTSFPTLVTMGGIVPADACPPPAILTDWRFYTSPEGLDGTFMVNLCSGKRLWHHRLRIWVMIGILSQSQIPRAHGTVSQVPADGFSLMKSQVGSIFQRDTTGTWLRTLLDQ
jgi:hypothetical protein